MKKALRYFVLGAVLSLASFHAQGFIPAMQFDPALAAKADKEFDRTTYWKSQALRVSVKYQNASLEEVVQDLTRKSIEVDLEGKGISFEVDLKTGDPAIAKQVVGHVSMMLGDASLFHILECITEQTHLIPLIHRDEIILVPQRAPWYSLPANFKQPANVR